MEEISSHFSTTHITSRFERVLPTLAPFLGRTFTKPAKYLGIIAKHLTYKNMKFFMCMVNVETHKVNVQGSANSKRIETGGS